MEPLTNAWIGAFTRMHPDVQFSIEFRSSQKAAPALVEGTVDIALTGRSLLPHELAAFEQKYGYQPWTARGAGGTYRVSGMSAVAFFVNKANPIERLSLEQLDAIFSKSRKRGRKEDIATWGQLGLDGEWGKRPVIRHAVKRPRGLTNFIQDRVLQGGDYKDEVREYPSVDRVVAAVAGDPAGIGYAGLGDVDSSVKTVALAENVGGPYYQPTFEEVVRHRYPLGRFNYIILNRAPGKPIDPHVKEFVSFVLSKQGQQVVQKEGDFLPLPAEIVKQERARLE
jgi:phosphate transport system substrate-binding protein